MRYIPSMIVQRKTDVRKEQDRKEIQLQKSMDLDPRYDPNRGQYDQAGLYPLIEDEE
jgi:hypothetical protein